MESAATPGPSLWAAVLITSDDTLLLTREGPGRAGGVWDVPRVRVGAGDTLAESVVRAIEEMVDRQDGICGPFTGWQELIDDSTGSHELIMYFQAVLLDDEPVKEVPHSKDVAEVRWVSVYEIPELRTRDGLAEFLSDQSIIDTVV